MNFRHKRREEAEQKVLLQFKHIRIKLISIVAMTFNFKI